MTLNQARRKIAVEQAKKETIKELKGVAMKGIQFQMELAMLLYLHDKEGFGKVRCERALNGFEEAWDSLNREYCTLDDVAEMISKEIGSELDPNTGNNAINFQLGLWNVLVWNYLPATIGGKPYFIMADSKFNQDYMAAPWVDRVKLTVTSDIDRNTDANVWYGRARFGAGFNNWRGFAISGEGLTGTAL